MRRAGCTADEIADARRAYRTLYRNRTPFRQAVEQLGETCTTDMGRKIYDFVREPSPRGYAPGPRGRVEN